MKRTCWVTAAVASIAALALSGAYQPVAVVAGSQAAAAWARAAEPSPDQRPVAL